eukprot:scaffold731_cov261-Pinguiococcus_pyrenoidosus.AAC.19
MDFCSCSVSRIDLVWCRFQPSSAVAAPAAPLEQQLWSFGAFDIAVIASDCISTLQSLSLRPLDRPHPSESQHLWASSSCFASSTSARRTLSIGFTTSGCRSLPRGSVSWASYIFASPLLAATTSCNGHSAKRRRTWGSTYVAEASADHR